MMADNIRKRNRIAAGLFALLLIVAAACGSSSETESEYISATVLTIAGTGISGFEDGPAESATFNEPLYLAIDREGNLLIADNYNDAIRVVTPDGMVSTLARGSQIQPQFRRPGGLIFDQSGDLIFSDQANHSIYRISGEGSMMVVAGSGSRGSNDGTGTNAGFYIPNGLAMTPDGSILVVDTGNYKIRKISPQGDVSTLAGSGTPGFANGTGVDAQFGFPVAAVTDNQGNIYVSDSGNGVIRKVTPGGVVTVYAGSGETGSADGAASEAQFNGPSGLAIDQQGNLYVADSENHRIRKVTVDGMVKTVAGSGRSGTTNGNSGQAEFSYPSDVVADGDGNLYVADLLNHTIRKIIFE